MADMPPNAIGCAMTDRSRRPVSQPQHDTLRLQHHKGTTNS